MDQPEAIRAGTRVFVIGIDGASWPVLDALIEADAMPRLEALVSAGSRGVLTSMDPTASAIIWTTLATGKRPAQHGIEGFVAPLEDGRLVPATSTMRKTKAIWNIASDAGLDVGFLGWWVTWPAEDVRGFMASEYAWPLKKDRNGYATGVDPTIAFPGRTSPESLLAELEPFVLTEHTIDPEQLAQLGIGAVPKARAYAVRDMLLKDISFGRMIPYLLDTYEPSLFAVYFDGLDASCHLFWPAIRNSLGLAPVGAPGSQLSPRQRQIATAVQQHMTRIDGYIGDIVDRADPGDVILVISDHGYGDNPGREPIERTPGQFIRPPHWHNLDGIIAGAGGPISKNGAIDDADVLDFAPTVLALLGLPVAEDMEGRVLEEMITPAFLADHPITTTPTYENGIPQSGSPVESPYDEAVLKRLRALGYLD